MLTGFDISYTAHILKLYNRFLHLVVSRRVQLTDIL